MDNETALFPMKEEAGLKGLIWGYRFSEDGTAEPLDEAEASRALERQDSWIWLHFDLIDGRAREALTRLTVLPDEARDLLLGTDTRQRIETIDHAIAGVIADFERADELDARQMGAWRFCMLSHAFISARRTPLHTMAHVRHALQGGQRMSGVLHLFDSIVHGFADALTSVSVRMAEQLDEVEDAVIASRDGDDFESLGEVRRGAVRLRRQATPLRSMLHQLLAKPPAWFTPDAAEDCTEVAQRVASICADLEALQERAHALQDEVFSRQTETTNRRLMLLSVMSAVLIPPTLISGIFGMNVDGLPLKDNSPFGFVIAMGMMTVAVVAVLFALRRLKMI